MGEKVPGCQWTPWASSPWHIAHFAWKISAPSLAVPLPCGSSFPDGPAVQARLPMSSCVGALPTPLIAGACGFGGVAAFGCAGTCFWGCAWACGKACCVCACGVCARAETQAKPKDNVITARKLSDRKDRIAHPPITIDFPRLGNIVSLNDRLFESLQIESPHSRCLRGQRLTGAPLIRRAGRDDRLFPVPGPRERKPRMRLGMNRTLNLRLFPGFASIDGDLNPGDFAPAGPGDAANLLESAPRQPLAAGRAQDTRLRRHLHPEPRNFPVGAHVPVHPVEQRQLIGDFDPPQPLDVHGPLKTGEQHAERKTLLDTKRLAILAVDHHGVV